MESEQREYRWARLALVSAAIRMSLAVTPAEVLVGFARFVGGGLQHGSGMVGWRVVMNTRWKPAVCREDFSRTSCCAKM